MCHAVFPVLRPLASQYALTLCHAVFPVLRLPALRPPASQRAPGLIRYTRDPFSVCFGATVYTNGA